VAADIVIGGSISSSNKIDEVDGLKGLEVEYLSQ
jgi:hypothetical protein